MESVLLPYNEEVGGGHMGYLSSWVTTTHPSHSLNSHDTLFPNYLEGTWPSPGQEIWCTMSQKMKVQMNCGMRKIKAVCVRTY